MALPEYRIFIRRCNDHVVSYTEIEFQQLTIIDKANDPGSWTISSISKEKPDLLPSDGIIVKRNGIIIYSGVLLKLESTYEKQINSWRWKASGSNDLIYFKWFLIHPFYSDNYEDDFSQRYLEYQPEVIYGTYSEAIQNIINSELSQSTHNIKHGYEIIDGAYINDPDKIELEYDISLRFNNALETIQLLAQQGEVSVVPKWNERIDKIEYYVNRGEDRTQNVIFSMDAGTLESVKYIFQEPEFTTVIYGFNSDKHDGLLPEREMWRYFEEERVMPNGEYTHDFATNGNWESGSWDQRFVYLSPTKEDMIRIRDLYYPNRASPYSAEILRRYASEDQHKIVKFNDTSIEVSVVIHDYPEWKRDFDMGDKVTILLPDGTKFEDKVFGIQIDFSYGQESMKISLGSNASGTFNSVNRDLDEVKNQFTKAKLGELEGDDGEGNYEIKE